jgi:hypothetical protein
MVHSPPSSAEVKNAWSYTSTPPIRLHIAQLKKSQGQLTFLPLYGSDLKTKDHRMLYVILIADVGHRFVRLIYKY